MQIEPFVSLSPFSLYSCGKMTGRLEARFLNKLVFSSIRRSFNAYFLLENYVGLHVSKMCGYCLFYDSLDCWKTNSSSSSWHTRYS